MLVQDLGDYPALRLAFGQHHQHASARANVLDVVREVLELVQVERPDHRALKLREESMVGSGLVEAAEPLFPLQKIDVLLLEPGLKERTDGFPRLPRVGDCPDHAIGRVPNEIPPCSARSIHDHAATSYAPRTAAVKAFACVRPLCA